MITGSAAWNSQAPRNFREVGRTPSFILWERKERTPQEPPDAARGDRARGAGRLRRARDADLRRQPGSRLGLPHSGDRPEERLGERHRRSSTGESTAQSLELPAGRWRLSLQYFSPFGLTLSAPGFSAQLVPALDGQRPNTISLSNDGQYWPAGEITIKGAGPVRFTLRAADASTLQGLTGYDGEAELGRLVAVAESPHRTIPLARSCGRWLDYYEGTGAP